MRSYPRNSPQAAARIVVLAMLADGHLAPDELEALDRVRALQRLGIDREALHDIVKEFCEDMLLAAHLRWQDACCLDARTLEQLMDEVDDPALRETVLQLCVAVVEADQHVAEGESTVLVAAVERWGLQHQMLRTPEPA